jgi:hypothetical protein
MKTALAGHLLELIEPMPACLRSDARILFLFIGEARPRVKLARDGLARLAGVI